MEFLIILSILELFILGILSTKIINMDKQQKEILSYIESTKNEIKEYIDKTYETIKIDIEDTTTSLKSLIKDDSRTLREIKEKINLIYSSLSIRVDDED